MTSPRQPPPPSRASDAAKPRRWDPALGFAWAVILAGAALCAWLAATGGFALIADPPPRFLIFGALVIAGELYVLRLPARNNDVLLSGSSTFAFATALCYGPGPAVAALCVGTALKEVRARRPVIKAGFNTMQHGLTVGVAGIGYQSLGGHLGDFSAGDLPAALGGAAAFLVVNYVLTGTVIALSTGERVLRHLVRGIAIWAPVEGVMLGFAPAVAATAAQSLWMIPLLMLPFAGVVYSARIARQAEGASLHDALTGLPNRVLFRRRVEQLLNRVRRTGGQVIVMVLDMDGFKEVNDTLGHGRGDALLKSIAERLSGALRDVDVVARLGGDEFGIVVASNGPDIPDPDALAERIHAALATPFQLADLSINAGTSIGIACAPEHGTDTETLIQHADVAMYQAKQTGTGYERYDSERDPNRPGNLRLLQDLREGIERDELVLHYQPKVSVDDGSVIGVEALARWQHPTRGLLMPGDFIQLAERTEVVRALTLAVVRDAARTSARWLRRGLELPVAVNLSPRVLLDVALPADIAAVLAEAGLPAELLEVEITESCLIAEPERTAAVLTRLSDTGVRISIDDFGTGYSSLALLKQLPVDAIKIDRSFVGALAHDPNDMVIVENTIKLAGGLGLEVVAEGVETLDVWRRLEEYGCRQAQGYYICRPLPEAGFLAWLGARETLDVAA